MVMFVAAAVAVLSANSADLNRGTTTPRDTSSHIAGQQTGISVDWQDDPLKIAPTAATVEVSGVW